MAARWLAAAYAAAVALVALRAPAAGAALVELQRVEAPPADALSPNSPQFGAGLWISADGATLVVGGPRRMALGAGDRGDAFVFSRDTAAAPSPFVLVGNISGPPSLRGYGTSVAALPDASVLFVGAPLTGFGFAGVVAVWARSGSGAPPRYTFLAQLGAGLALSGDRFGASLAVAADGSTLAVGAIQRGGLSGAVFVCSPGGGGGGGGGGSSGGPASWASLSGCTQPPLVTPDAPAGADALFGSSLALDTRGSVLVVGAPINGSRGAQTGAAYVFPRLANGTWDRAAAVPLMPTCGPVWPLPVNYNYGDSVALSADGRTIAVGSKYGGFGSARGSVHVFDADAGGGGGASPPWRCAAGLVATDASSGDGFGASVAFAGGSRHALLVTRPGRVYLFTRPDAGSPFTGALVATPPRVTNADSGAQLAIDSTGSTLAVSAPGTNSANPFQINGSVDVFVTTSSATPSATPGSASTTPSGTGSATGSSTGSSTATDTGTGSPTGTQTGTGSPTGTPTGTGSPTATQTGTGSPTGTPSGTGSASRSRGASATGTASTTATASATGSASVAPSSSGGASPAVTRTPTMTPSPSGTASLGSAARPLSGQAAAEALSPAGAAGLSVALIVLAAAGGWVGLTRQKVRGVLQSAATADEAGGGGGGGRRGGRDGGWRALTSARSWRSTRRRVPTALGPSAVPEEERMGIVHKLRAASGAAAPAPPRPATGGGGGVDSATSGARDAATAAVAASSRASYAPTHAHGAAGLPAAAAAVDSGGVDRGPGGPSRGAHV